MANWLSRIYWNAFTLWHARSEARLPYLPLERIEAIQNRRVRAIVAHAYRTVPYYRRVMDEAGLRPEDFQTAADLARLPILTGRQLAADPADFRSTRHPDERSFPVSTSGTSGYAKKLHYDPGALFLALAHGHRQRIVLAQFVGRTFGYREMNISRPDNVGAQMRAFYEARSWVPRRMDFQRRGLAPVHSCAESVAQINAFSPDVLLGYGSYIGLIFRWAWEHSVPIHRPRVVWYSSDHMPEADRRLLEEQFGVPVFSTYQAIESLRIGYQCERRHGWHVNLDRVAIRVVDGSGNAVAPGDTGEMIISNLTNRATVLLNYQLGDVVTLGRSACPCGRSLPTIERIDGRADDMVIRPGGRVIHGLVVMAGLSEMPGVAQAQVIQEAVQRFRVRVVRAGESDWALVQRQIAATLRARLGDDITLEVEPVDALSQEPGGKVRSVISRIEVEG